MKSCFSNFLYNDRQDDLQIQRRFLLPLFLLEKALTF